jgi:Cu-processing system permease protein
LYDLVLLGALLADEEQVMSEQLLTTLLMLNPTDAYRVFNLTATESISQVVGLADLAASTELAQASSLLVLGVWMLVAIGMAVAALYRREL